MLCFASVKSQRIYLIYDGTFGVCRPGPQQSGQPRGRPWLSQEHHCQRPKLSRVAGRTRRLCDPDAISLRPQACQQRARSRLLYQQGHYLWCWGEYSCRGRHRAEGWRHRYLQLGPMEL
ncbi:hypothetical protein N657DRAFT_494700 [Parathielavia appendiculata]|uniref:Uncharacterized protein n=1 Tax=Parathielavia appendiculata TaxID=2587402 RepID=A0AAN6TY21_9PEZI|nr:hypothetical protein N657DRAFT_494700 [Parathielavia appendiculata]